MDLRDKVAIVTGGGTGLGREVSLQLAAEGARLALVYSRSEREAQDTARACAERGGEALAVRADVSRVDDVSSMVQEVRDRLGRIDILVNNAGTTIFMQSLADIDSIMEDDWDRIMAVNVKGAFLTSRAVAPHMRAAGGGAIVSITSVAGLKVTGSSVPYAVSKAALIHLTRFLATALAPDIRVNSVAPGLLLTRWWGHLTPERIQQLEERAPLQRATSVEDCAAMVVATIKNDSLTGQTIVVDAGVTL